MIQWLIETQKGCKQMNKQYEMAKNVILTNEFHTISLSEGWICRGRAAVCAVRADSGRKSRDSRGTGGERGARGGGRSPAVRVREQPRGGQRAADDRRRAGEAGARAAAETVARDMRRRLATHREQSPFSPCWTCRISPGQTRRGLARSGPPTATDRPEMAPRPGRSFHRSSP